MSRLSVFPLLALLSACGSTLGNLDTKGFVHGQYPYTVDYPRPNAKDFINSDWRLDNFYEKQGKLTPKGGTEYETETLFDVDGDGEYETKESGFIFDLRFEHKTREQVIWLRTVPIDQTDENKNLDVIMRDYVDAVAGSGYAVVSLTKDSVEIREKRFATEVVGQRPVMVAGRSALLVVFDVANVDQLSVNSEDRTQRVALLFVRTGYQFHTDSREKGKFPVIMVVGYASHPSDFEQGLPSFEYFTSRIVLRNGTTRGSAPRKRMSDEDVRKAEGEALSLAGGSVAGLLQAKVVQQPLSPPPTPSTPAQPAPVVEDAALPAPPAPAPAPVNPTAPAS